MEADTSPGDHIEVKAEIGHYSSVANLTVRFNYIFDRDLSNPYSPYDTVLMGHMEGDIWGAKIPKKYDSGKVHYWINITDIGNRSAIYNQSKPGTISYSAPLNNDYVPCLIGFFIAFIVFEVLMRYGILKKRLGKKEGEEKENPADYSPEKKPEKDPL